MIHKTSAFLPCVHAFRVSVITFCSGQVTTLEKQSRIKTAGIKEILACPSFSIYLLHPELCFIFIILSPTHCWLRLVNTSYFKATFSVTPSLPTPFLHMITCTAPWDDFLGKTEHIWLSHFYEWPWGTYALTIFKEFLKLLRNVFAFQKQGHEI